MLQNRKTAGREALNPCSNERWSAETIIGVCLCFLGAVDGMASQKIQNMYVGVNGLDSAET